MCAGAAPTVRVGSALSDGETAYRTGRAGVAAASARTWLLSTLSLLNSTSQFVALNRSSALFGPPNVTPPFAAIPLIGIAAIGEGLPGAVATAGMISALDGSTNATAYRHGFGLLSSATYLSAANGAAWAVLSASSRERSDGWYALARSWASVSLYGPAPLDSRSAAQLAWTANATAGALAKAAAGFNATFADARAEVRRLTR